MIDSRRILFVIAVLLAGGCQPNAGVSLPSDYPAKTSLPSPAAPATATESNTFNVIFDEGHSCRVDGPEQLPVGKYTFRLDDRSGLDVDLNVVHLIDGHGYQDLLDLQEKPGEPFVKVNWMSLPFYFTTDHVVWTYTLDEPGEHAILILQHVFEGSWICQPFQVVD